MSHLHEDEYPFDAARDMDSVLVGFLTRMLGEVAKLGSGPECDICANPKWQHTVRQIEACREDQKLRALNAPKSINLRSMPPGMRRGPDGSYYLAASPSDHNPGVHRRAAMKDEGRARTEEDTRKMRGNPPQPVKTLEETRAQISAITERLRAAESKRKVEASYEEREQATQAELDAALRNFQDAVETAQRIRERLTTQRRPISDEDRADLRQAQRDRADARARHNDIRLRQGRERRERDAAHSDQQSDDREAKGMAKPEVLRKSSRRDLP